MVNDKLVGKNRLTLIHNTEHDRVRYKFHNKFTQSIESPFPTNLFGYTIRMNS